MTTRLNPVALPHGLQKEFVTEFVMTGRIELTLGRIYFDGLDAASPLGPGIFGSYDVMIRDGMEEGRYELVGHTEVPVTFERPPPQLFAQSLNGAYRHLSLEPLPRAGLKLNDRARAITFQRFTGRIWRPVRIEDRVVGTAVLLDRDSAGVLERLTHPDGLSVAFENDARGRRLGYAVIGTDGSRCPVMRYTYDAGGRLCAADNAFGESWRYEYDADGHQIAATSDAGTRSTHVYDAQGRVTSVNAGQTYKQGHITYDFPRVEVAYGADRTRVERLWFDAMGRHMATAQPDGAFERRRFNDLHDVVAIIDGNGNTRQFEYDAHGNLQTETDGAQRETFAVHDDLGRLLSVTDPGGGTFEYTYDDAGHLIGVTSPLGHRTDIRNNAQGQPVEIMRHDGLMELRRYDAHHRLVEIVDYNSAATRFDYDVFHRVTTITGPDDACTDFAYEDVPGRPFPAPSRVTAPNGEQTRRSFTPAGDIASITDASGGKTVFGYGPYRVLEQITDPAGHVTMFKYDSEERLICVTNPRDLNWTFERDACGRIVREIDFDGREIRYAYDWGGRMIRRENPDGSALEYGYDRGDLMTEIRAFEPGSKEPWITRYRYDEAGRLIEAETPDTTVTLTRDAMGRIIAERTGDHVIESELDCCGNRVARVVDGQRLEMAYDGMGNLARWHLEGHVPLKLERDPRGFETRRSSAEGFAQVQAWDVAGQLVEQWAGLYQGVSAANLEGAGAGQRTFEWGPARDLLSVKDSTWGSKRYRYDANAQVTGTLHGDGRAEAFRYGPDLAIEGSGDAAEFLDWQTSAAGVVQMARGPAGEHVTLEHDANGRVVRRSVLRKGFLPQTWSFRWNALDQMVGVVDPDGVDWRYRYDGFGRRVSKLCAGSQTRFVWDRESVALEIADGAARAWFYEPGSQAPMARLVGRDLHYVVCDHLGTPKEILSEAGACVWAADHFTWGRLRAVQGMQSDGALALAAGDGAEADPLACPIRFRGQWQDAETGLYYNEQRYYDPLTAQYLSPDPIGIAGGLRLHGYVAWPNVSVDPHGLIGVYIFETVNGTCYVGKGLPSREARSQLDRTRQDRSRQSGQPRAGCCSYESYTDLAQQAATYNVNANDFALMVQRGVMDLTGASQGNVIYAN